MHCLNEASKKIGLSTSPEVGPGRCHNRPLGNLRPKLDQQIINFECPFCKITFGIYSFILSMVSSHEQSLPFSDCNLFHVSVQNPPGAISDSQYFRIWIFGTSNSLKRSNMFYDTDVLEMSNDRLDATREAKWSEDAPRPESPRFGTEFRKDFVRNQTSSLTTPQTYKHTTWPSGMREAII